MAVTEHVAHVGDILGIEVAHIERFQCIAANEHVTHIGDFFGVQVPYALDILQIVTICEPRIGTGGAVLGKRGVEYGVLNIFLGITIITYPSGALPRFWHIIDGFIIRTGGAQIVIIESERLIGC